MDTFLVRVNFCERIRFISLQENELNAQKFVDKDLSYFLKYSRWILMSLKLELIHLFCTACSLFNIQNSGPTYLTDNLNTHIFDEDFEQVIKTFHKGNFFIRLNVANDGKYRIVTAADLKIYLLETAGAEFLFKEIEETGTLTDRSRCRLVDFIVKFMQTHFKDKINKSHKIMMARAAIALFPNFKTELEEGYVSY